MIYVPVTGADGGTQLLGPADASTVTDPMAELQVAGSEGPVIVFPGAVAPPPAPVYTGADGITAVITNPNPEPGADPASVTLYTSDRIQTGDTNSYLQVPDLEGEVGSVIYVPVTGADGSPADASTLMAELTVAGPDPRHRPANSSVRKRCCTTTGTTGTGVVYGLGL